MRFVKSTGLNTNLYHSLQHPSPSNLTYLWNFGVYAVVCLLIQVITGIFLAMHYTPEQNLAFFSVEHIMRDVNYGWLLRYIHANGASMFFIVVYVHIFRGIYFASYAYPRFKLWAVGVILLFVMIVTGFMGYVLPWGQMSFWGATVITNLVSVVPFFGQQIVIWLWGGYAVENATLNRFYSLHYLMPFLLVGLTAVHLVFLHQANSNNPVGVKFFPIETIPFFPYFVIKDSHGLVIFFWFYSFFLFFAPNYLGHPDNYIQANPLVTPPHIVPEWYYLTFYAVLRSIPNKLLGVIGLLLSIFVLLLLPVLSKPEIKSLAFRPVAKVFFWIFFVACYYLCWIGGQPAEYPYIPVGQFYTLVYFLYFILQPFLEQLEKFFGFKVHHRA
jgi:ubiquinol-cytochrome c reductase cytochrome b/c1 subunit